MWIGSIDSTIPNKVIYISSNTDMFSLTFGRITFERIKLKKIFLKELLLKELICIWFEYIKNKFKKFIFILIE